MVDDNIHAALADGPVDDVPRKSPQRSPWSPWGGSQQQYLSGRRGRSPRSPRSPRSSEHRRSCELLTDAEANVCSEEQELRQGFRVMEEKLQHLVEVGTFSEKDVQQILADAEAALDADVPARRQSLPSDPPKPKWWGGVLRRASLRSSRPQKDIPTSGEVWSDSDIF